MARVIGNGQSYLYGTGSSAKRVDMKKLKLCQQCMEEVEKLVSYKKEKMCEACRDYFEQEDTVYEEEYNESLKYR